MSSADDGSGPQPTAHDYDHGCTLSRREAMQTSALALAALAGAGAGSGTVAADDDWTDDIGIVDGLKAAIRGGAIVSGYSNGGFGLGVFVGALTVSELRDQLNTDPSADRHILHQLVHNEIAWMDSHLVNFGNYMTDTRPIASLEARHGIASAWEDGEGASGGYDRALQRIRQYYELPEFNHLHAGNKALLQLSYIANSGQDTDPPYEILASGEDEDGEFVQVNLSNERVDVELELHDGTTVDEDAFEDIDNIEGAEGVVRTPVFEFIEPPEDGDSYAQDGTVLGTSPIDQDVIESWDGDEVAFTDDDGNEFTTSLRLSTQNLSDDDDEDEDFYQGQLAFDGPEFFEQLHEVGDLSDTVVSQYDIDFVEDIYAELDAGNLEPEQVRSPEGMARFLSGTDDVEDERFQISWMQQFGFERADMSLVSGMEVEWTGATDTLVDSDPDIDYRRIHPDEMVDSETYSGVLFGSDVGGDDGFQAGGRYLVGPHIHAFTPEGVSTYGLDGSLQWDWESEYTDEDPWSGGATPDGERLIYNADTDTVGEMDQVAIDARTGEELWREEDFSAGTSRSFTFSEDSEIAYIGGSDGDDLYAMQTEDGNVLWTESLEANRCLSIELDPDDQLLYVGGHLGEFLCYDTDGNHQYDTHPGDDEINSLALSKDRETVFALDGGGSDHDGRLMALDAEDGTSQWDVDLDSTISPEAMEYASSEGILVVFYPDGEAVGIDTEEQDIVWSTEIDDAEHIYASAIRPDEQVVYGGQNSPAGIFALDPSDGSILWTTDDGLGSSVEALAIRQPPDIDGVAPRALMFDESDESGEGQGQIDLWSGILEVTDMWDADGATVEHVNDETISDLEDVTGEDIETIVDEMDEFDDVDDIRFTRDVISIFDEYDVADEDREDVHTEEPDYEDPDYDSFDSSEFAAAMEGLEAKIEQLESEQEDDDEDEDGDDDGWGLPTFGGDGFGGDALAGLAIIAGAVLVVVSVVTDLLPWT